MHGEPTAGGGLFFFRPAKNFWNFLYRVRTVRDIKEVLPSEIDNSNIPIK